MSKQKQVFLKQVLSSPNNKTFDKNTNKIFDDLVIRLDDENETPFDFEQLDKTTFKNFLDYISNYDNIKGILREPNTYNGFLQFLIEMYETMYDKYNGIQENINTTKIFDDLVIQRINYLLLV